MRSSLSLPLVQGGRVVGGLNLYAARQASFGSSSRASARAFARQAVVMLGHLQQLHTERAARTRERELSAQLQRALLPTLPDLSGISCAARYRVGSEHAQVGGDWYDLFPLPDGAIGLAIGDVTGHDLAAAAMGQLRSVLRSYAYEGHSPSGVLDRLDRLVQDFDLAQFATAIYGRLVLDSDAAGAARGTGTLLSTNAGHPPPLLRLPDGSVQVLRRGATPLIGALPPDGPGRGREGAVALPAGSVLVLYTDGLVEHRDSDLDAGIDALAEALADLDPHASLEQLCDHLLSATAQDQQDDVTVLAIRLDPTDISVVSTDM